MPRVLFVDDERSVLNTLRRQLTTEPYEQVFVQSGEEGLDVLRDEAFDVIVSDMRMPTMNGVQFLTEARKTCTQTRRIVLTGYADIVTVTKAINEAKIHAYLEKPWDIIKLKETINNELKEYLRDKTEEEKNSKIKKAARRLFELATMDELTGIPNRRSFDERFKQEWGRASRELLTLSLLIIDIDHFKKVNDTAGHREGDRVLKNVAQCLQTNLLRSADFLARYGGEEFAAILPNTNEPQLIAERLRTEIEKNITWENDGATNTLTVSIGIASCKPSPQWNNGMEQLIQAADAALYEAKHNGRNRVEVYPIQLEP